MLPFVATLPGNDEFRKSVFDAFFVKLEEKDDSAIQEHEGLRRLQVLMHWLADQTSPQLALNEVCKNALEPSPYLKDTELELVAAK